MDTQTSQNLSCPNCHQVVSMYDRQCPHCQVDLAIAAVAAEKPGDKKAAAKLPEPVAISDEQLLALATERAGVITDYLVSEHAIPAGRLVACQPAIDATVEGKPRVDLLI